MLHEWVGQWYNVGCAAESVERTEAGEQREKVMATEYITVAELRRAISEEILVAAGVPRTGLLQTLLSPLLWYPAHRFASLAAEFDRRVALSGLTEAMRWILPMFVDDTRAFGLEHLPTSGPLVIASNHPGSYDALAIGAHLGRDDLRVPASDVPALRHLRATSAHLIYTRLGDDSHARISAARESIRHLRSGGALLVYAGGKVEPDPAVLPGAKEALKDWSGSLAWFLRQVPDAVLVVTIVSNVLAPSCLRNPVTRLRKEQRRKQFLAETVQIGQQVLFGRRFPLTPEVRFGLPLTVADLGGGRDAEASRAVIVRQAERLLTEV
jgi:hypothetical protein